MYRSVNELYELNVQYISYKVYKYSILSKNLYSLRFSTI